MGSTTENTLAKPGPNSSATEGRLKNRFSRDRPFRPFTLFRR